MTVKEYLGQAYLLDKRIKSDSMELDELRLMAETISSPGFKPVTSGTSANSMRLIYNYFI